MRALLLSLILACPPAPALAQDEPAAPVDTSRDEEARALFNAGRTAYEAGRFADALAHFQHSYELSGRHVLLFNIGSALDRLRRDEEALEAFETYLRLVPDAPNAPEVAGRVAVLRSALEERRAAAPPDVGPVLDPDRDAAPPPPRRRMSVPIASIVLEGLTLATGALAVWSWIDANDRYAGLERGCLALRGGCSEDEIAASGVETQVMVTNVLLGSAITLGAGGVLALALELSLGGEVERPESATLRVGPGSLSIAGAF